MPLCAASLNWMFWFLILIILGITITTAIILNKQLKHLKAKSWNNLAQMFHIFHKLGYFNANRGKINANRGKINAAPLNLPSGAVSKIKSLFKMM